LTVADVLVIGGCNFDIKAKSHAAHRLGTSNPGAILTSPGGVGRNIAHNLARLGADVALLSVVGDDELGSLVLEASRRAGVNVDAVVRLKGSTGSYVAMLDQAGELVTAMSDMALMESLDSAIIAGNRSLLDNARLVIADCNLPLPTLQALADIARDKLLVEPVSVPKAAKLLDLMHNGGVCLATPNLDQLETLSGTREAQIGMSFLHTKGLRNVVVHAGQQGAFCSDGNFFVHVNAAPAGPVLDVTGAGDGAVAGLAFGLLQGLSLPDAVAKGQKLAGKIVSSPHSFLE
jgi:pseudouridine kinase